MSTELVPTRTDLEKTPEVEEIEPVDLENARARPATEVVSDQEKHYEEQLKKKAPTPKTFFERDPIINPPKTASAEVNRETLLGFLAAFEKLAIPLQLLSGVKVHCEPGAGARMFLEASSTNIWTAVSIDATVHGDRGFAAVFPLPRGKAALKSLPDKYKTVVVGLDENELVFGELSIPFAGRVDEFPAPPAVRDAEAQAVIPAFYLRAICSRVLCARSLGGTQAELHGMLLDFEKMEIDGETRILTTAVATDGHRMHVLRLPQMMVRMAPGCESLQLPPTIVVPDGLLRYLAAIVQRDWTAVEISETQVTAAGDDYMVVAKAAMSGRSVKELSQWRKSNVSYEGYWMLDYDELNESVHTACDVTESEDIKLRLDASRGRLEILAWGEDGEKFKKRMAAKRFGGAATVDVIVDGNYFLEAIAAAESGLVRLEFHHDVKEQARAPVIIRGEDEQFKAILMPKID